MPIIQRKKEEIWLSPMTEALTPTEKSKKQRDNTKNATKNFDYTTIADRLKFYSFLSIQVFYILCFKHIHVRILWNFIMYCLFYWMT